MSPKRQHLSHVASQQFGIVTLDTLENECALVFQSHSINSQNDESKQDDPTEIWVTVAEPPFNGEPFPACGPQSRGRTDLSKGWVKIDRGASGNNKEAGGLVDGRVRKGENTRSK